MKPHSILRCRLLPVRPEVPASSLSSAPPLIVHDVVEPTFCDLEPIGFEDVIIVWSTFTPVVLHRCQHEVRKIIEIGVREVPAVFDLFDVIRDEVVADRVAGFVVRQPEFGSVSNVGACCV